MVSCEHYAHAVSQSDGANMQSCYLQLGGVNTHYAVAGTGPPVMLLAGVGSSVRASWAPILPSLAEHFRVHALDLPGQGDCEKPATEYTFERGLEMLAEFLLALKLKAVHLVGTSAGGLVALGTALRYPELVKQLVLIDNVGFGREVTWGLRLATLPLLGELAAMPKRWLIKLTLLNNFTDPRYATDALAEEFYRVRRQPGAKAAVLTLLRNGITLKGIKPALVLRDQLHRLQAPTLIIWGKNDKLLPVTHAYVGHRLIPSAQLHIIQDAGHDPVTERPAEVASAIKSFLQ